MTVILMMTRINFATGEMSMEHLHSRESTFGQELQAQGPKEIILRMRVSRASVASWGISTSSAFVCFRLCIEIILIFA